MIYPRIEAFITFQSNLKPFRAITILVVACYSVALNDLQFDVKISLFLQWKRIQKIKYLQLDMEFIARTYLFMQYTWPCSRHNLYTDFFATPNFCKYFTASGLQLYQSQFLAAQKLTKTLPVALSLALTSFIDNKCHFISPMSHFISP